ncbi:MAG: hypothetical protein CL840_15585 [Crocinitomicaceae bacterium]|mgnify:CR=1 FL=1|nr:hypothetical protein [Crocinitomicaceae bacterium]|tara:strand:+ start:1156 stop:1446 length:291 start_codon:yes stop_codon:yes gene_type:complete
MSDIQENQTSQEVETPEVDERLQFILDEFGYDSREEVSDGDYTLVEDLFIQGANDLIYAGEDQIEALEAAGFTELAEKFKRMSTVSGAYDWTRENL